MTQTELLSLLVAATLKCGFILGCAGIVVSLYRRGSAAFRHLVWSVAVASCLAVPGLSLMLPRWDPGLSAVAEGAIDQITTRVAIPMQIRLPEVSSAALVQSPATSAGSLASRQVRIESLSPVTQSNEGQDVLSDAAVAAVSPDAVGETAVSPPNVGGGWTSMLFVLWAAGAIAALLPLMLGMLRLRLLCRSARQVRDGRWAEMMERLRHTAAGGRRVSILESEVTTMPMTWGIVRPALLVPARSGEWTEWQCRNVLMHELAHVERRDCLTQLLAQILCAIHWFNPLVWYAAHRMRVERELACDDRVLAAGSVASDYAANLLDVARSLRAPSYTSQSAIAMARPSQLSGRLLAVLDAGRKRSTVTRSLGTATLIAAIAIALPLASLTPGAASASESSGNATDSRMRATIGIPDLSAGKLMAIVHATHVPNAAPLPAPAEQGTPKPAPVATTMASPLISAPAAAMPVTTATSQVSVGASVTASPSNGAAPPAALTVQSRQTENCWEGTGRGSSNISMNDNDKDGRRPSWTVRYTRDDCSLEVRAEGRFTLRADLSDVETLDRDGLFRVEERSGRDSRRVEIGMSGGALEHLYYVNGDRRQFDGDARSWLARTLLSVERRTAFAAATRVPQLYRSGGLRAVTSEISLMPSAYPKAAYYKTVLDMGIELDAGTLNSVVNAAASELSSSDYYLAEVLGKLAIQPRANESTWRAFADASSRMKSDYYKAATIGKILKRGRGGDETVRSLLRSASTIKSDYYMAEVLKSVAADYAMSADTRQYYVEALRNISSDYYRRQVLMTLNGSGEWDSRTTAVVLASVNEIKSAYEKSQSLIALAKAGRIDNWASYFAAANTISSSYYQRQTMEAALKVQPLTREIVAAVLTAAPRITSDSDLGSLLSNVAKSFRIDNSMRPAYEKATDAISSDHYRGAALVALRKSMAQ